MNDERRQPKTHVDPKTEEWTVLQRHELFNRLEARQPQPEALDQLQLRMAAWTILYESAGDDGRSGAESALTEVIEYFAGQGLPYAVLEPLTACPSSERLALMVD